MKTLLTARLPDGSQTSITASGDVHYETDEGCAIHIAQTLHAPQFTKNLISVDQITKNNNLQVILTETGGYLVKRDWKPQPDSILSHINKTKHGYAIAQRHIPFAMGEAANINKHKKSTLDRFMRKRKPTTRTSRSNAQQQLIIPRRHSPMNKTTPKVRGHTTDKITTTIPYPHHLPDIPETNRKKVNEAYSWHLKLNHISLKTISAMAFHMTWDCLCHCIREHPDALSGMLPKPFPENAP